MNALDSRRIRTAFVDGNLLGHTVQIDGALQKAPGGGTVCLGTKQEIDRVAITIDGSVQVLPLASNFDVGLIHAPTHAHRAFAPTKHCGEHWQDFDGPAVHGGVIDGHAAYQCTHGSITSSGWCIRLIILRSATIIIARVLSSKTAAGYQRRLTATEPAQIHRFYDDLRDIRINPPATPCPDDEEPL